MMQQLKPIPVTEASPDETQTLRYKLVTLPKGTTKIPKVEFGVPSISVNQNSVQVSLTPTTSPSGNTQSGYTVVLSNKNKPVVLLVQDYQVLQVQFQHS